jgi:hypothetical protein
VSDQPFAPPKPWWTDGTNLFAWLGKETTVTTLKMDPLTIEIDPGARVLLISRDGGAVWNAMPVWDGKS